MSIKGVEIELMNVMDLHVVISFHEGVYLWNWRISCNFNHASCLPRRKPRAEKSTDLVHSMANYTPKLGIDFLIDLQSFSFVSLESDLSYGYGASEWFCSKFQKGICRDNCEYCQELHKKYLGQKSSRQAKRGIHKVCEPTQKGMNYSL